MFELSLERPAMKRFTIVLTVFALTLFCSSVLAEGAYMGVNLGVSENPPGILIQKVWEDSPAAEAGLLDGDVITAVDGVEYAGQDGLKKLREVLGQVGTRSTR
ncbi:MAG: PDZ domain-containing protein [Planctomycetota bacterium]|nr:PDZ domain-containing protein [Planctomycetota bacterium]